MAEDGLRITHQLRLDAITDADPCHLGLFEICIDPIAVSVDDREVGPSLMRIVADPH